VSVGHARSVGRSQDAGQRLLNPTPAARTIPPVKNGNPERLANIGAALYALAILPILALAVLAALLEWGEVIAPILHATGL
jgi:hypothetical protein